jgi:hypothetical protein
VTVTVTMTVTVTVTVGCVYSEYLFKSENFKSSPRRWQGAAISRNRALEHVFHCYGISKLEVLSETVAAAERVYPQHMLSESHGSLLR